MRKTFEIREDVTDENKQIFDVYEQLSYDSEYLESFYDRNDAIEWVYDTYGRDVILT